MFYCCYLFWPAAQRLRKGTTSELKVDMKKGDKKDKKGGKMNETVS